MWAYAIWFLCFGLADFVFVVEGLLSGFVGWLYLVVFVGVVCYGCVLVACGFIVAFITLLGFWCSLRGWVCGLVFDDLLCLLFEFGFWCSLCGGIWFWWLVGFGGWLFGWVWCFRFSCDFGLWML